MQNLTHDKIRQVVRDTYGKVARGGADISGGCGCGCGPECAPTPEDVSVNLGYSGEDVSSVPDGANLGLGCGNPQAIAALKPGETVLDLGSGGGFDCFLAARSVGDNGHVIGVDMTPDMLEKARENAAKAGFDNVEFRLGEIEHIPAADDSVDVIISNCVINLSPQKSKVFEEAFRILKKGGRLAVSDIVATAELPEAMRNDLALYAGCVAGAELIDNLKSILEDTGFTDISIEPKDGSRELIRQYAPGRKIEDYIMSANIEATKPL